MSSASIGSVLKMRGLLASCVGQGTRGIRAGRAAVAFEFEVPSGACRGGPGGASGRSEFAWQSGRARISRLRSPKVCTVLAERRSGCQGRKSSRERLAFPILAVSPWR